MIVGTKLDVRGLDKVPKGACLIVSKHQSAWDTFGLVPLFRDPAIVLKDKLNAMKLDVDLRVTVLGHVQRGGSPTAFDGILATRFGIQAVELALQGRYGHMVGLRGTRVVAVPLSEATAGPRTVDLQQFAEAEVFFG